MQSNSLYTDAQWEWIAKRYLEGHRIAEITRFLGVHPNTVARHLDQVGADRMLVPLEERKQEFLEMGEVVKKPPQNNYFMNRFTEVK